MLARRGLNALVAGLADGAAAGGLTRSQASTVAFAVMEALRDAGAVTPHYDGVRFADALTEALAEQEVPFQA